MEKIGESVAGGVNRRVQIRKTRANSWTKAKRNAFLDHLAATCNVAHSARSIGMTPQNAHALRRRDPAFGQAWADALEQGYAHIEAQLLARAIGQHADAERGELPDDATFDPDFGWRVMASRRNSANPNRRHGGVPLKRATMEELDAELHKKCDALAKRLREKV